MTDKKWYKKPWLIAGIMVGILLLLYLGVAAYFVNHFFYNTSINNQDFSFRTEKDVLAFMEEGVKNYTLTLKGLNEQSETIAGTDIGLTFVDKNEIKSLKEKQNPLLWPISFFESNTATLTTYVSYDEALLEEKMMQLQCIANPEQTDPVNAFVAYDGEAFAIQPEVYGTKMDVEITKQAIKNYITAFTPELPLDQENCYLKPALTSESPELATLRDTLNQYCSASITYNVGSATEVVDKNLISGWLTFDESYQVTINEEAIAAYVATLAEKYNTVGRTRQITTPTGKVAEVSGGSYGWKVDQKGETAALLANITAAETVTRDIVYSKTAASREAQDWGSTYVEVDMSAQHMWYIIDGAVAFECDVVTGLPTPDRATPQGVNTILERIRGKTLVGNIDPKTNKPAYETPVRYWARVTYSGIGFHDADWQPWYGGNRYKSNGSHGCINMPVSAAATFYEMIKNGTPVIIHF